jgi:hypothetical protein
LITPSHKATKLRFLHNTKLGKAGMGIVHSSNIVDSNVLPIFSITSWINVAPFPVYYIDQFSEIFNGYFLHFFQINIYFSGERIC